MGSHCCPRAQGRDERREISSEYVELRRLDGEVLVGELVMSSTGSRARELDSLDRRMIGEQPGCHLDDLHGAMVPADGSPS